MEPLRYNLNKGQGTALAVFVHGRAGSISAMNTFKRCIPEDWSVLFLEAPYHDPIGGYSWWRIGSTDSADEAAKLLMDSLDFIFKKENLSIDKTVALGFSQGAALLSIILQQNPKRFSALGLLAGFVFRREIQQGEKPKILIVHGTKDETVPINKAIEGYEYLKANNYDVDFHSDPVGHKVGSAGMKYIATWIKAL